MNECIVVQNLSFSYGNKEILSNVSFTVTEGKSLVLLGLNGSGKTTLINCMMGFLDFRENTIKIYGKDLCKINVRERSKLISFVSQEVENCSLSVYEYISLGRIAGKGLLGQLTKLDEVIINDTIELMNINGLLKKQVNELSGGERQIISIARALVQDTPIIVMDEPTSALDYKNQIILLKIVKKLNLLGKTVIFSSHNPNHALALNAQVGIVHEKTIIKFGEAKEILTSEVISVVYGDSVKIISADGKDSCIFYIE